MNIISHEVEIFTILPRICQYISTLQARKTSQKIFREALLKDKQFALNLPTKNLAVDNKTRWNSCLKMMKRLIKSRETISVSLYGKFLHCVNFL